MFRRQDLYKLKFGITLAIRFFFLFSSFFFFDFYRGDRKIIIRFWTGRERSARIFGPSKNFHRSYTQKVLYLFTCIGNEVKAIGLIR